MKRIFHMQTAEVTPAQRLHIMRPATATASSEVNEILFANLRRMLVLEVDSGRPAFYSLSTSTGEFDHAFLRRLLEQSGQPDVELEITASSHCICNSCHSGYPSIGGTPYHVHRRVGGQLQSIGVFGRELQHPDCWMVYRIQDLPHPLETQEHFKLAIGWALDDALHECAVQSYENSEFESVAAEKVQDILTGRMRAGTAKMAVNVEWQDRIQTIAARVTIRGAQTETITAQRRLVST